MLNTVKKTRKYQSWGQFLKTRREARFRSAREFCAQIALGISYPQYSRYEAGEQLPSLDQAITMTSALGVSSIETLLEWSRTQVDQQDKLTHACVSSILADVRKNPGARESTETGSNGEDGDVSTWSTKSSGKTVPLDDLIVFNRSHLRLFESDPSYRDIFTYINSFGPDWIGVAEISLALSLPQEKTQDMLQQLHDLGVITLKDSACRASKRNYYFPDDQEFFDLRNLNLTHNTQKILGNLAHEDLTERRAYRGLLSREMTLEQVQLLLESVDQLMGSAVALPESSKAKDIYSLCVLFGRRFSRWEGVKPGLRIQASPEPQEATPPSFTSADSYDKS